jgi:hypothetical protein
MQFLSMKWVQVLSLLQQINLPLEAQYLTLDAEMKNTDNLYFGHSTSPQGMGGNIFETKDYASKVGFQ